MEHLKKFDDPFGLECAAVQQTCTSLSMFNDGKDGNSSKKQGPERETLLFEMELWSELHLVFTSIIGILIRAADL